MIRISVQEDPFDIAAEIVRLRDDRGDIGAIVTFTGLVRDFAGDDNLHSMTLEHHPVMTEKQLRALADDAWSRWSLLGGCLIHRYGTLQVGEDIVLVAIASAHRQAAFDAAMFLMDWLKTKAPFWKKEFGTGGAQWVAAKSADTAAADKWLTPE